MGKIVAYDAALRLKPDFAPARAARAEAAARLTEKTRR
jgi:hypothetical protein